MTRTFENWLEQANAYCESVCGLSLDDLPDGPSRDAYDDGVSPKSYVRALLREEGF